MPDFTYSIRKTHTGHAAKMEKVYLDFSRKIAIANDPKALFSKSRSKFSNNKEIRKRSTS